MYDESSFIGDGGTGAVCVVGAAEGVRVGERICAKFIKIVIIWFIYCCWFCSICISKFIISDVCDCWEDFIFCLSDSAVSFFKMIYALINASLICCSLKSFFFIFSLIFIFIALFDCLCHLRAQIHFTTARVDFILLWFIVYIFQWFWFTDLSGASLN